VDGKRPRAGPLLANLRRAPPRRQGTAAPLALSPLLTNLRRRHPSGPPRLLARVRLPPSLRHALPPRPSGAAAAVRPPFRTSRGCRKQETAPARRPAARARAGSAPSPRRPPEGCSGRHLHPPRTEAHFPPLPPPWRERERRKRPTYPMEDGGGRRCPSRRCGDVRGSRGADWRAGVGLLFL